MIEAGKMELARGEARRGELRQAMKSPMVYHSVPYRQPC